MNHNTGDCCLLYDRGNSPAVLNIDYLTKLNTNFRLALWTGEHLQVTLMCIPVCGEIGEEMHNDTDQVLFIESGRAIVKIGKCNNKLDYVQNANENSAIFIPAGTWHNIINAGNTPLKLYSIYAPPHHPFETVHETKKIAELSEKLYP